MTHAHSIGGRDFNQSGGASIFGALGLSDFVTATMFEETKVPNWITQTGTKLAEILTTSTKQNLTTSTKFSTTTSTKRKRLEGITLNPSIHRAWSGVKTWSRITTINICSENNDAQTNIKTVAEIKGSNLSVGAETALLKFKEYAMPHKPFREARAKRVDAVNDAVYEYCGAHYPINVGKGEKHGCYEVRTDIMEGLLQKVNEVVGAWQSVLIFRFDLDTKHYEPTNQKMARFMDLLVKRLKRVFKFAQVPYVWVREQEKAANKKQHYHCALFLDAGIQSSARKISKEVRAQVKLSDYFGRAHIAGFMEICATTQTAKCSQWDSNQRKFEAVFDAQNDAHFLDGVTYGLSYLAKLRGKNYQGKDSRNFSFSQSLTKLTKTA